MATGYSVDSGTGTASSTWPLWNLQCNTSAPTMTTTTGVSWLLWNQQYVTNTGTTTTATGGTWVDWNRLYSPVYQPVYQTSYRAEPESEEARQAREEKWREQKRQIAEAKERAARLLKEHLAEEQRATYEKERYFDVISRDGQRRYRIQHGRSGNIQLVDAQGKRLKGYCIHPRENVPDEDTMLAQKLMIEHEEERFLRVANAS